MTTTLTYEDGDEIILDGKDAPEIDLVAEACKHIYSIIVRDDADKIVFSAYVWDNQPQEKGDPI